jgi:hypothetical protein
MQGTNLTTAKTGDLQKSGHQDHEKTTAKIISPSEFTRYWDKKGIGALLPRICHPGVIGREFAIPAFKIPFRVLGFRLM